MEGTINDKDPVIVDRGVNEFIGEGIYVVTWHGLLYIKRLQMADEEHFRLISDNQHYENQTARIDDVTIHAKVLLIWNARKA
ncbi:Peptidase S24-like protein [compost metagenome]